MRVSGVRLLAPVVLLTFLVSAPDLCGPRKGKHPSDLPSSARILNANRVQIYLGDRGSLDNSNLDEGAFYVHPSPPGSTESIVCDQGPWVIGKINGTVSAGISYWGTSYMPGPVIGGRPALLVRPQDSLRYHPYRLDARSDSTIPDYSAWPADLGAPVDQSGRPRVSGDEMVWSVFNGADSTARPYGWVFGPFPHIPVEIQQAVYERAASASDTSLLASTAFMEWTIVNKGTAVIESCYVALWTDIDFDNYEYNFPAVDTSLQVGYCWDAFAAPRGSPFAVGYVLLHGPVVPDPSGNATFRGRALPGYRNLPITSFWGIITQAGPESLFTAGAYIGTKKLLVLR